MSDEYLCKQQVFGGGETESCRLLKGRVVSGPKKIDSKAAYSSHPTVVKGHLIIENVFQEVDVLPLSGILGLPDRKGTMKKRANLSYLQWLSVSRLLSMNPPVQTHGDLIPKNVRFVMCDMTSVPLVFNWGLRAVAQSALT